MFFGTKLIEYQASFYDLLNLWCFYSITAPHYANYSTSRFSYRLSGSELRLKMCRLHCTSHIPQCLRLRVKCYQDDNLFHQRFTFYGRALLLFYGFTFKFEGSKNYIGFVGSLLDKVYVYFEEHKKQTRFCPVPN